MEYNDKQLNLLKRLLSYSDKYEISIQFWPNITTVFISKDGIDLKDYGGDFEFAIESSIKYLDRINNKK